VGVEPPVLSNRVQEGQPASAAGPEKTPEEQINRLVLHASSLAAVIALSPAVRQADGYAV